MSHREAMPPLPPMSEPLPSHLEDAHPEDINTVRDADVKSYGPGMEEVESPRVPRVFTNDPTWQELLSEEGLSQNAVRQAETPARGRAEELPAELTKLQAEVMAAEAVARRQRRESDMAAE